MDTFYFFFIRAFSLFLDILPDSEQWEFSNQILNIKFPGFWLAVWDCAYAPLNGWILATLLDTN